MRSYVENDIVWIPVGEFAQQYQKHRSTIVRWAEDGFLLKLGFCVKRDISGCWLVGKPLNGHTP